MKKSLLCLLLLFVPLFFCAAQVEEGIAGRLSSISASLSAAHISLAPGTRIRVTNMETGRSITVVINRRLNADSGHIVELTVPAAEAIGLKGEARVRVEPLSSDSPSVAAEASESAQTERASREPVALPPIRTRSQRDTVSEQKTETEDENDSGDFYYVNSYEGEYPGDPENPEPPLPRESGPSPDDIVTLQPETDRPAPPSAASPARTRPVPPPPVPPPAQAQPAPSSAETRPAPPAVVPPPAPARPAQPAPSPAQTRPVPPPPVPPPAQAQPAPSFAETRPAPPAAAPAPPPASSPSSGQGTASARLALPADTDRVVLSMNRDESGKLWVYVESETAREVAVTEVPRPTPLQAPIRPPSQTQTPPPVPPALVQAPPPVPPPAPERRQVTVTIIPRLPPAGDGKRYILQVGSYRDRGMAEYRLFNLQNAGIATVMESQGTTIRIIVNGVYAEEIPALAEKLGKAGVTEIWVRER